MASKVGSQRRHGTAAKPRPSGDLRHENLGRLLMESFRFFRLRTLVNLRAHGFEDLNPVHAAMLRRVDEGGNHISDIAARMGVTKQAAAQLVARTEQLGYVHSRADPVDSRKKTVLCTPRGRRFLGALEGVVADSVRDVAAIIGADRLHALEETLKLIAAARGSLGAVEEGVGAARRARGAAPRSRRAAGGAGRPR